MTRVSRMPWPRFSHAIHAVPHNSQKLCRTFVNEGGRLKLACVEFIERHLSDLRIPTSCCRNKLGCEYLLAELGYHGSVLLLANLGNRSCEFSNICFCTCNSLFNHWTLALIYNSAASALCTSVGLPRIDRSNVPHVLRTARTPPKNMPNIWKSSILELRNYAKSNKKYVRTRICVLRPNKFQ